MQKPIPTERASIAHRAVNWALFIGLMAVILSVAFGAQP